jgi:anti-sigma regulatory factor (Ser/Thr protein kinase)
MTVSAYLLLSVPADRRALPAVRSWLRQWLSRSAVDDASARDVVLAAWEACVNAVEHPVGPVAQEISLEACASVRDVSVSVRDTGRWRHRQGAGEARGLGLMLVRALMDEVDVQCRSDGTEIRMRRSRRASALRGLGGAPPG